LEASTVSSGNYVLNFRKDSSNAFVIYLKQMNSEEKVANANRLMPRTSPNFKIGDELIFDGITTDGKAH
jgi:hypothetical protein